ncbi:hypothetical protein BDZ45DRAFT_751826 [Acephala macrosclerotiorum]|nr:hypothetical protein BDZ45DRAFT_751826 [Acephala macrosclerotiorum]
MFVLERISWTYGPEFDFCGTTCIRGSSGSRGCRGASALGQPIGTLITSNLSSTPRTQVLPPTPVFPNICQAESYQPGSVAHGLLNPSSVDINTQESFPFADLQITTSINDDSISCLGRKTAQVGRFEAGCFQTTSQSRLGRREVIIREEAHLSPGQWYGRSISCIGANGVSNGLNREYAANSQSLYGAMPVGGLGRFHEPSSLMTYLSFGQLRSTCWRRRQIEDLGPWERRSRSWRLNFIDQELSWNGNEGFERGRRSYETPPKTIQRTRTNAGAGADLRDSPPY